MPRLALVLFFFATAAAAHPSTGIVVAPNGDVFRITPRGERSVAVRNVHAHELVLEDGAVAGEDVNWEGGDRYRQRGRRAQRDRRPRRQICRHSRQPAGDRTPEASGGNGCLGRRGMRAVRTPPATGNTNQGQQYRGSHRTRVVRRAGGWQQRHRGGADRGQAEHEASRGTRAPLPPGIVHHVLDGVAHILHIGRFRRGLDRTQFQQFAVQYSGVGQAVPEVDVRTAEAPEGPRGWPLGEFVR